MKHFILVLCPHNSHECTNVILEKPLTDLCFLIIVILVLQDLYACVDYIQSELTISRPELTALVGRSAGALPVAMFCNLWPHKTQAALLQVTNYSVILFTIIYVIVCSCSFHLST